MSVFVPNFECDVFVSFASADNERSVHGDNASGWVTSFIQTLNTLLGQKLGSKDWGEIWCSSAQSGEEISLDAQRLTHSALLVVVLSEAYLNSPSCLAELENFVSTLNSTEEAVGRIAVLLRDDLPRERWPACIRHLLVYELLEPATNDSAHLSGTTETKQAERVYSVCLDDLSTELAHRLHHLRRLANGEPAPEESIVYLAESPDDAAESRASVKRYLIQDGFRVLPEYWYPRDPDAFYAATTQDLKQAVMFAQLLGAKPFQPGPMAAGGSYAGLQQTCAEELGTEILQWRPQDLDLQSIADPEHRRLLQGEHVVAVGLEEFKRKVVKQAHALAALEETPAPASAYVVVNADDVDQTLAQEVGDVLVRGGVSCDVESQAELPLENISATRPGFAGLVIVYGACPAIWVRQQLWRYRKAMARSEAAPPLCAVYEGPPQSKDPVRFNLPTMKVINGRRRFDEPSLQTFIAAVRGRFQ